jgi:hypothetical protein
MFGRFSSLFELEGSAFQIRNRILQLSRSDSFAIKNSFMGTEFYFMPFPSDTTGIRGCVRLKVNTHHDNPFSGYSNSGPVFNQNTVSKI